MRYIEQETAGWGNLPTAQSRVYRPEKRSDVDRLFGNWVSGTMTPRGMGRSYGDAAVNEGGGIVLGTRLNRMLAFDAGTGLLEAEGGVTLGEILDVMVPRGWFVPVTPGTKFVTLGGAVAADVHGKNHHRDGCFSNFIAWIDLTTGMGETLRCSREENADVFWATVGGLGLTGFITRVAMVLRPVESAYCKVEYTRAADLDGVLAAFAEDSSHTYSVAWIDCLARGKALGRSVLMRGEHARAGDLRARLRRDPLVARARGAISVPVFAPGFALSPLSVRAFNTLFYHRHTDGQRVEDYDTYFYPLDRVLHWNRLYGRRGFAQYQAVLPAGSERAGLRELLEVLTRSQGASFLAVLKTMGEQGEGYLSFPMKGHTLALDLPNTGDALRDVVRKLDRIVLAHGGRVYLAKDALLEPETFEQMYPRVEEFRAVVERLDPMGRMSSSMCRRLGIRASVTAVAESASRW